MNFIQKLINELSLLKEFVILSLICTVFFFLLFLMRKDKFSITQSKMGFFGILFELKGLSFYLFICVSLNIIFLISTLFRYQPLRLIHVWMLILLLIACLLCSRDYKMIVYMIINQVLAGIALVIINILVTYLKNVRFEWMFFSIYIVASLFLCLYFIYMYLNNIRMIMKGKFKNEKICGSDE